jgi:hypothetical protein
MTTPFYAAGAKPKSTTWAAAAWKKYSYFFRAFTPGGIERRVLFIQARCLPNELHPSKHCPERWRHPFYKRSAISFDPRDYAAQAHAKRLGQGASKP